MTIGKGSSLAIKKEFRISCKSSSSSPIAKIHQAMGGNEEVGPSTRSKRSRYRDDDDDDNAIEVENLDGLVDVDSEEDFMAYD
ncbi:hypothetical protein QVD17_35797 [Tagetes erecta]|uniref:Uncharacterized protein n=1 Tax=Tagetes erecta TaxID=13708 RepID=A0AAD8JV37_TARER|nr:hypothetical protein QVD17_35797 [Tagetes erecta]